ncbi:HTH-type transcriptional activator CmpR [Burkholderiales bacterium]|nr:HTH-type transcriptional activator CmpR [Burkholderiales bacterium]
MELEPLRLFLRVAATGSFSRAAALVASTQPAVSKRIGALERELGARLFERTGRGARLTQAGRRLLPRAESLTAEADRLADVIADGEQALRGVVRVASQPSVSWPLVGDLVALARDRHPAMRLQIAEGPTRQIEEWLGDGRIDLGIVSVVPPPELGEFHTLFEVPLMLVARAGDPEVRRRTTRFARFARLPLAIATMPNGGRVLVEEEARRAGLELNVAVEVNSIHVMKKLVARGGLYSLASQNAIADEVAAGELAGSRIVEPEIWQSFHLVIGGRRHAGAAVQAVAHLIRELAGRARGPARRGK